MRKITHQARAGERHGRGGRHALARLPAPAGVRCTRRSACGHGRLVRLAHLRSSSGTRTQAAHDSVLTVAAAERPSSGTAVPAALGRLYATRRSCFAGCPARDVVTALVKRFGSSRETQVAQPSHLPATAGTGRRWRGQSGYRRTEDRPATVITSGGR
jgi:hypothetical protein